MYDVAYPIQNSNTLALGIFNNSIFYFIYSCRVIVGLGVVVRPPPRTRSRT